MAVFTFIFCRLRLVLFPLYLIPTEILHVPAEGTRNEIHLLVGTLEPVLHTASLVYRRRGADSYLPVPICICTLDTKAYLVALSAGSWRIAVNLVE